MIAKGVPHAHGARLARYLVTGKDGERTQLLELRGFASAGIVEAFHSVSVMARATKCFFPFFHVSVRNPAEETLDSGQWAHVANAIEQSLGLADQPRAVAFHICEATGESHMHVAWSRIDQERMTAKPLPFFKERLKRVSRELEKTFDLTPVSSLRKGSIVYGPTRREEEQARRLRLNLHEHRESIRDCFDRSDCGRSFQGALLSQGMVLAQGDRRDFVVVDSAGGMHALGMRILGISAEHFRKRLSDLVKESLPTVEQTRRRLAEQAGSRERNRVQKGTRPDHSSDKRPEHSVEMPQPSPKPRTDDELDLTALLWQPEGPGHALAPRKNTDPGEAGASPGRPVPVNLMRPRPDIEGPSSAHVDRSRGAEFARVLKKQFRTVVQALVKRLPPPGPKVRSRRGETVSSFRCAARHLLRPIIRLPWIANAVGFLNEMLPWFHLWEWNEPAANEEAYETPCSNQDHHSLQP